MGHDAVRAGVPASARAQLRELFTAEVTSRLPRLALARSGDAAAQDAARRDAHTLGSSAWVVGEPEIAALARAVELDLDAGPLDELLTRLRAWTP